MRRRTALSGIATIAGTVVAGCLGGDDGSEEVPELELCTPAGGDPSTAETGGERRETGTGSEPTGDETDGEPTGNDELGLAEKLARTVADEFSVVDWWTDGSLYHLQYTDGDGPAADVPHFASAYADVFAEGFEYDAMPTALDDDGEIEYMFIIERHVTDAFVTGELSEAEYHETIRGMIH